jgi:hypothetical protein
MSLPRPNESYHFQANLIWWDSPFKGISKSTGWICFIPVTANKKILHVKWIWQDPLKILMSVGPLTSRKTFIIHFLNVNWTEERLFLGLNMS